MLIYEYLFVLQAHKLLLAATSDYFRAMFSCSTIESRENCVDMKGLSSEALENMISFIYSGRLELTTDNLCETLDAASHLQIRLALDLCSDFILSLLNFANAEIFLQIADNYHLVHVKDFYNSMVLEKFEAFTQTDQFLSLTPELLHQYLSDDRLCIRSEMFVLEQIGRWLQHDEKRLPHGNRLLSVVRFALMSQTQLEKLLHEQNCLLPSHLNASNYVAEGLQYHRDCSQGQPSLHNANVRSSVKSLILIYQGLSYRPLDVLACNWQTKKFYQLTSDNSCSRDCRIVFLNNFIYMNRVIDCGGGLLLTSLMRFDPRHLVLTELAPSQVVRLDAAVAAMADSIFVFGGCSETGQSLDSVERYDIRKNAWFNIGVSMPMAIYACCACSYGDMIFVCGGISDEDRQPCDLLMCFNTETCKCEMRAPMNYSRRLHEMVTVKDFLYVAGGIGQQCFHQQSLIPMECYSIATNQWSLLTTTLVGRSVGHFVVLNGQILSVGREHQEAAEDDVWLYDFGADRWQRAFKVPRRGALACSFAYINFCDDNIKNLLIKEQTH